MSSTPVVLVHGSYHQPAHYDELKCTPSLYIATRHDHTWPPSLADKFAQRCANVVSIDTGHSPYLSAPDLTASIIRDCL
jgi:pimeloyl-ACP methyl ester carboxylesterase